MLLCLIASAQDFSNTKSKDEYPPPFLKKAIKLYDLENFESANQEIDLVLSSIDSVNNVREYIMALEQKARIARRLLGYKEASPYIDKAVDLSKEYLEPNDILIARVYRRKGIFQFRQDNLYDARSTFDTTSLLYENASLYDSALYKSLIDFKYYSYFYSSGSVDTLIKYIDLRKKLLLSGSAAPDPKEVLYLMQDYTEQYRKKGDLDRALSSAIGAYKYTIENKESIISEDPERFGVYAFSYTALTQVLSLREDYEEALEIAKELELLLDEWEMTPDKYIEYYSLKSYIGQSLLELGRLDEALYYFEQVLNIGTTGFNAAAYYALTKLNISKVYQGMGHMAKARQAANECLETYKNLVKMPSATYAVVFDEIGDLESFETNYNRSFSFYDSAINNALPNNISDALSFPYDSIQEVTIRVMNTLLKKSGVLQLVSTDTLDKKELLIKSLKFNEELHNQLIERRAEFGAADGKLFLSNSFRSLYEGSLNAAYELYNMTGDQSYISVALAYFQRSKSLLFLEQREEVEKVNNNFINQDLKYRFNQNRMQVNQLEASFYPLLKNDVTSDSMLKVNDMLNMYRLNLQGVMDTIEMELELANYQDQLKLELSKNEVLQELDKDEMLVEYFYGEKELYILTLSHYSQDLIRIPVNQELEQSISIFLNKTSTPPSIENYAYEQLEYQKVAYKLYELLVEKAVTSNGSIKKLLIVPDEILSRIPFEALVLESGEFSFDQMPFLINEYSVRYGLSSSNLGMSVNRSAPNSILGLGFSSQSNVTAFSGLPGTEREINALKGSYEGTFINSASKSQFLELSNQFDILHLAVHGISDTLNKFGSKLIFSSGMENELVTADLYMASPSARLAILSACESGIGLIEKGEGTFSIARGFAIVGVPSIVMSLWSVNDKITAGFMTDMYRQYIDEGKGINSALRTAKLDYLNNADAYFAHPYYWAAFIQLGEDIEFSDRDRTPTYALYLLPLSLLVLIFVGGWIKKRRKV